MHINKLVLILFSVVTLHFASTSYAISEWQEHPADSAAALAYGKDFVDKYRYDLVIIDTLAENLLAEGRLHEVVNLYRHARKYHPKNSKLLYKLKLAKSDLQERESLQTFNHQQYKKFSRINEVKLDEIMCKTLHSKKGTEACERLGIGNNEAFLANNISIDTNYKNIDEKIASTTAPAKENAETIVSRTAVPNIDIGSFHALVIGNNNYPHFPELKTAVSDANAVANVLKNNYGFKVTTLENAGRYEIFEKLSTLRKQLDEKDNLLIYYAGHGYLDEDTQRGYWLPVDAEEHNYANWLSTTDITDMLNGMSAKRVLVVADSCYSGTLTRNISSTSTLDTANELKWLKTIINKKSRTVMTSGGLEPVLDSGPGNHSVFTQAFINALIENDDILEVSRMFSNVRHTVLLNADQTPEYADIRKAGHEGGDFIFIRVN